ncbi:MAG: hypothetical protein J7L88_01025, partial [Thermoplasmata archaeon]|nr:hypothetical protein [Thermoplasmata archaeon]
YIMRRGVEVDYVTFSLAGPLQMRDALLVADLLVRTWSHGYRPTLYLVNFAEVLTEIEGRVRRPLQGVVLRHLFYRAAEMLAGKYGHLALVTGESLGQVSSQTLQNLHAASGGISLPILRPLLGMDKEEIISQAKRIGTADISSHVVEYCAITGGGNVSVKRREIEDALDELNLDTITKAVERVKIVHLPGETEKVLKELEKEIEDWRWSEGENHEGVVFVNYRGGVQVSLPEGFPLDEEEVKNAIRGGLRGGIRSLPREFRYVFSCPTGGWAMRMVEALRTYGYNAYYTS